MWDEITYPFQINPVSGKALVPSGNKPLSEPVLTQIYITIIWYNQSTMSEM